MKVDEKSAAFVFKCFFLATLTVARATQRWEEVNEAQVES
jgi:hypothetical protein